MWTRSRGSSVKRGAASALNHPHIVQIYEIAKAPTAGGVTHYIAMELVEGMTLRGHLKIGGRRTDLIETLIPAAAHFSSTNACRRAIAASH
jgi:serine/threonine protein kinase